MVGLKLRARDLEDLSVISSMTQDALAPLEDMMFLPDSSSFMVALNRFRWEDSADGPPYRRGHAGLRFDTVNAVKRKGVQQQENKKMLSLLAISYAPTDVSSPTGPGTIVLSFAEDVAIRLDVDSVLCALEDLGDPWPTQWLPNHSQTD